MIKQDAIEIELRNELIRWGTPEESLTQRPVTKQELLAMRSREYLWHSRYNSKNVDLSLSEDSRKQQGQKQLQKHEFQKFWTGDPQNRVKIANEVAVEFQNLFPQFLSCEENTTAIVKLIQQRGQLFNLQNVIAAYQTLCAQAVLWITPENAGLAGSEAVRGKMLTSIKGWERVLEPVKVLSDSEIESLRVQKLSAEDYQREFMPKEEVPALILRRIESDVRDFCKRHPEYDPENGEEGKEIMLSWIRENQMVINRDSLEAAYQANKSKLQELGYIFSEAPGIPVHAPGGVSTLIDHRKPAIPANERSVVIREPESAKRFSMAEILAWDSATMMKMMQQYPELQKQIDSM